MAAPPVCAGCGTALPRAAIVCPRCGRPVYQLAGRRARRRRNASVVGLAGSLMMAAQSACMLVGGSIALVALSAAASGELDRGRSIAGTAAILVGFALLFDLVGVAFLIGAFHAYSRASGVPLGTRDPERRSFLFHGFLATIFLLLWLLVTLAWRGALAAIVTFYPTPFGGGIGPVATADVQRAASIMLGLWVTAAFLLFLGAVYGTRFLARARGMPITFPRLLWPFETFVHVCAAVAILIVAPGLLANLRLEMSTLSLIETLGAVELIVVPVLGLLAYTFLFRDFVHLYRASIGPIVARPPPEPVPAEPPAGGT